MSHSSDTELDKWYREEHVPLIAKVPGYRRTTRYTLRTRSVLSALEPSLPQGPKWMACHEFESAEIPWDLLKPIDETEWTIKIGPGLKDLDVAVFELKRVFPKAKER